MLVVTRKTEERIQIGPHITLTVLRIKGHAVKLGIEAPPGIRVLRGELIEYPAEVGGSGEPGSAILGQPGGAEPVAADGEAPSSAARSLAILRLRATAPAAGQSRRQAPLGRRVYASRRGRRREVYVAR